MKRRGFFQALAGCLGLAAVPTATSPIAKADDGICEIEVVSYWKQKKPINGWTRDIFHAADGRVFMMHYQVKKS